MQRLSIDERSRGSVGTAVVTFGVGAAVSGAFAACGSVGTAVVAFGVGAAVSGAFAACGSVGTAVLTSGVGAAVSESLSACRRGGDVVIIQCHADPFLLPRPRGPSCDYVLQCCPGETK